MVHCQFGQMLETTLRDRFVCGLRHEAFQWRFLSENTLTYAKALEIARGLEVADKETKAFKSSDPAIKKLGTRPKKPSVSQSCHCCGRLNHKPADCKFKDAHCHSCRKTGHIAPVCWSKVTVSMKDRAEHHGIKKTHCLQDSKQSSEDALSSDS